MTKLYDKFYGCIAGSWVGSSMGNITEAYQGRYHLTVAELERTFGRVEALAERPSDYAVPTRRRSHLWSQRFTWRSPYTFKAGETEDGIERQKLMSLAIMEKKGRITASDLADTINRVVKPERDYGYRMWEGDELLYSLVKAGLPANYVGMFSHWPGVVQFTRACHPIGLINACDPEAAAHDAWNVGMLYQPLYATGLPSAVGVVTAIAEACRANATKDSVIEVARRYCGEAVRAEIDACLEIAGRYSDVFDMREEMNKRYEGYDSCGGEELLAKGLAIFYVTAGNVRDTIVGGANFGRDTDCVTAIAAGISGTLSGPDTIPADWIATVDAAEKAAEHTVSNLTCQETVDGLYAALQNEITRSKQRLADLAAVLT